MPTGQGAHVPAGTLAPVSLGSRLLAAPDVLGPGRQCLAFGSPPLVADRIAVHALVLVAGMIPAPGEPPDDWVEQDSGLSR